MKYAIIKNKENCSKWVCLLAVSSYYPYKASFDKESGIVSVPDSAEVGDYIFVQSMTYDLDMLNIVSKTGPNTEESKEPKESEESKTPEEPSLDPKVNRRVNAKITKVELTGDIKEQFLLIELDTGCNTGYTQPTTVCFDNWIEVVPTLFKYFGESTLNSWVGSPVSLEIDCNDDIIGLRDFLTDALIIEGLGVLMDDRFEEENNE